MRTTARGLALAGLVLAAPLAGAQPDRLTLLNYHGYDALGLTGQLVMWGPPIEITVGEDGSLLFTNNIYGRNQPSRGVFKRDVGSQPVAIAHGNYNVAGYDYDTAMTEAGPDDILRVCNTPWYPEQFRSNGAGGAVLYAELETPLLTSPNGLPSYSVLLEGDGSDDPQVIWRFNDEPVSGGEPIAPWHDVRVSPDGVHTVLWHESDIEPRTRQIATAQNDLVDSVIIAAPTSGAPVADGMDPPDGFPAWNVINPYLPVVGTSGLIAFSGWLLDETGAPADVGGIFVAREGVGYTLLYDPRDVGAVFPQVPATMEPERISHLMVTDDERVLVYGDFVEWPSYDRFYGVWSIDLAGNSTPLLLSGEQAPGFAPGTTVDTGISALRLPVEPIRRYRPAKPYDGHTHVAASIDDGTGETRQAMYSIPSDGSLNLLFAEGDPVSVPGGTDAPYELPVFASIDLPRVHYTADDRFVCAHRVRGASGELVDVILYRDDAGDLTTLPLYEGVILDFDPSAAVDEATIMAIGVVDMNDSGLAALWISRQGGPWITGENTANALVDIFAPDCPADTNSDGLVTPADFNAWILAFNAQAPECDQNGDGLCTPADFNAWILNFNAGC